MQNGKGRCYILYNRFRDELDKAATEAEILEVFACLLPSFKADTAAILIQPDENARSLLVGPQTGETAFWNGFRQMHRASREALSRIFKLCNYPIAFSDIQFHPRLHQRLQSLHELMAKQGYTNALIVPLFDKTSHQSVMVISGRALTLSPSKRHWMVQAATDVAARIANSRDMASSENHSGDQPDLTPRQLEVAPWVVGGKSDWEIGVILNISQKTVNFHVENMKRRYGVKTRAQFVAAYVHDYGRGALP